MLLDAFADKAGACGQDEIAAHPFPHEVKLVAGVPHVVPRTGHQIRLPLRVIRRGASGSADVRMRWKDADRSLSTENLAKKGAQQERKQAER